MINKKLPILLLSACIAAPVLTAAGTVYKWVDASGNVQYTQTPPTKNAKLSKTMQYDSTASIKLNPNDSKAQQLLLKAQQAHRNATEAAVAAARATELEATSAANRSVDAAANAVSKAAEMAILKKTNPAAAMALEKSIEKQYEHAPYAWPMKD